MKRTTRNTPRTTTTKAANLGTTLAAIAKKHLGIETLATRKSDSLDFHSVAVWSVKSALLAAYNAGHGTTLADANAPAILTTIAKDHLLLDTLDTRKSDRLDFSEQAVWGVSAALQLAYYA